MSILHKTFENKRNISLRVLLIKIFLSFRPKTITAAIVPCVSATALAGALGYSIDFQVFWFAILSSVCIQIGTNLVNDAIDFKKGADTNERKGPERITQSGFLTFYQVMGLAGLFFLMAVLLGWPLVIKGGWVIVLIGTISLLMGYGYTGGPFPLAYLGLGEIFVVLFFGWIAVSVVLFLHSGNWLREGFLLGTQIGLLATVLIAINNFRDSRTDILVGKNTLAARFGSQFSRLEIAILCLSPFCLGFYWWIEKNFYWATFLPLLTLPLAIRIVIQVYKTEPSEKFNQYLGQAALLHMMFGLFLGVGFFLK